MNSSSLKKKTVVGLVWTISGIIAQSIIRIGIISVLSRLLVPQDFGIIAASMVVVNFSIIFSQLGVGPAIIQKESISEEHLRTGFVVSVLLGLSFTFIVYFSSPIITNIFGIKRLQNVLEIMSIIFVIQSISIVSRSLLQRDLQFKRIAIIEFLSYVAGYGGIGITLAYMGYGPWALVWAIISQNLIKSVLLNIWKKHPIGLRITKKELAELLTFGSKVTWARISNYVANQADYFIVGTFLGAHALGLYERTYKLMSMPANLFRRSVNKVIFPVMSKIQNDTTRLGNAYQKGLILTALVVLPLSVGLFILSRELIVVILGEKWSSIVIPFKLALVGMYFRVAYGYSATVARSYGAVTGIAVRQTVYAGMVMIGALLGYSYGITGVVIGVVIALCIHFLLLNELVIKVTSFTWSDFVKAHLPALSLALITGLITFGITTYLREIILSNVLILLLSGITSVITIGVVVKFFPNVFLGRHGREFIQDLLQTIKKRNYTSENSI